jgi:hypothetical protein
LVLLVADFSTSRTRLILLAQGGVASPLSRRSFLSRIATGDWI